MEEATSASESRFFSVLQVGGDWDWGWGCAASWWMLGEPEKWFAAGLEKDDEGACPTLNPPVMAGKIYENEEKRNGTELLSVAKGW